MNISSIIEVITPELAREYLKFNDPDNRPLKTSVDRFARDMLAGNWRLTGEPIIFDEHGLLIDGQNRLHACIKAGVPFTTIVVRGVPAEARRSIDTGITRTAGDLLHYQGVEDGRATATIVRLVRSYTELGGYPKKGGWSQAEIEEFVAKYPEDLRAAAVVYRRSIGTLPGFAGGAAGACYFLAAQVAIDDAEDFFVAQVIDGLGLKENSPAFALRKRFSRDTTLRGGGSKADVMAYAFQAFNHFRAGTQSLLKLQAPHDGWRASNRPKPQ